MATAKIPEPRGASAEPEGSEYFTVAAPAKAQLREKMSRFIAFVFPVESAEQAKEEIARIAADYHDARHVCWAYRLGASGDETQCNDNGEPSGTAGRPILGQIRSAGLTNVAVAVVRYFGGIKLGTSGLISAYKEATRLAIEDAEIITRYETATVEVVFPYMAINDVMRVAKDPGIRIVEQVFDNSCMIRLEIRADKREQLLARLTDIDGVTEK